MQHYIFVLAITTITTTTKSPGPARNPQWNHALELLINSPPGRLGRAIAELAEQRSNWMHEPDLLIRACRHYVRYGGSLPHDVC